MIYGVGTDIVEYTRFEKMYSRYGDRIANRMLSDRELAEFRTTPNPARYIAKRFAAKEVGSGLREPVSLRRISITHDSLGKPLLMFDATLGSHLNKLDIAGHHLSISDEQNMIVAFVVLERA